MGKKKADYIAILEDIFGGEIDWKKLTTNELSVLADYFSDTERVIADFTQRLTPQGRAAIAEDTHHTAQVSRPFIGSRILENIPTADQVLAGRPVLRKFILGE